MGDQGVFPGPGGDGRGFPRRLVPLRGSGVRYPDGYIQLLDRAKDIIISGGENISTIEVENALMSHPAVADVAVIAVPTTGGVSGRRRSWCWPPASTPIRRS